GKGVQKAVKNANTILFTALKGKDFDQRSLDQKLIEVDGTPNKGKLGANAILGISLAFSHAAAQSKKMPLWKY
ncbi:phosphopyruvate hydratase, partial [Enterobacter roggenkampii]